MQWVHILSVFCIPEAVFCSNVWSILVFQPAPPHTSLHCHPACRKVFFTGLDGLLLFSQEINEMCLHKTKMCNDAIKISSLSYEPQSASYAYQDLKTIVSKFLILSIVSISMNFFINFLIRYRINVKLEVNSMQDLYSLSVEPGG